LTKGYERCRISIMTIREMFAKRLREMREERGWSQAKLSRRVTELGYRLDKAAMSRIEGGQRTVTLEDAVALAAALGVPLPALFVGEETEEVEITSEIRVRTPFLNGWLAGKMPLDPADAKFYSGAVDELNARGGLGVAVLAVYAKAGERGLNERERKMTEAVIETYLSEADDFDRVAARLDPEDAERVREAAQNSRHNASVLKHLLEEES
jgi:transcriptional regulator with XRE-family HTH domain